MVVSSDDSPTVVVGGAVGGGLGLDFVTALSKSCLKLLLLRAVAGLWRGGMRGFSEWKIVVR